MKNSAECQTVRFPSKQTARHIQLKILQGQNGDFATVAEIGILDRVPYASRAIEKVFRLPSRQGNPVPTRRLAGKT